VGEGSCDSGGVKYESGLCCVAGLVGDGRTWIVSGWVAIGGAGGMTYNGTALEGARLLMFGFDG
jgi:hypothetical protein